MKIKTNALLGPALDWAVEVSKLLDQHTSGSMAESIALRNVRVGISASTNWQVGGPIIEREKLSVGLIHPRPSWAKEDTWWAKENRPDETPGWIGYGSTFLIAAMRCYVFGRLGEEVDIPDDLCS